MRNSFFAAVCALLMGIGVLALLLVLDVKMLPPFAAEFFPATAQINPISPVSAGLRRALESRVWLMADAYSLLVLAVMEDALREPGELH